MLRFQVSPREIPKTGDDSPAGSLVRYVVRMSGHHQVWICIIALAVAGLTMVPLEVQRRLVNDVIVDGNLELLLTLGLLYLAVLVLQGALKLALRLYQAWLSESAVRYNRRHLAKIHECRQANGRTGNGKAGESETAGGGRAVSVIGAEIDRLGGFVGEGFSQPVVNLGILVSVGGYMVAVEPTIAAVSLIFLVPQIILVPVFQRWINRLIEKRLSLVRALSDSVSEMPGDCSEIQDTALPGQIDKIYRNKIRISLLKFTAKALTNFLNALGPLCVLVFGGYMVIQGETTIGTIVAFVSGFDRLSGPLRELIGYYRVAAQAHVQHQMIAKWMARS